MARIELPSLAGATMMESQYGISNNKRASYGAARAVELLTLGLIMLMAFSIRLFSVLKYESVIHEFDPYFNYRVTALLTEWMESDGPVRGLVRFWNFFDSNTWYPLGRIVGGTLYPGLMLTAATMWWVLHALNIPIHIADVCVFTAPIFSANTAWATYLLGREVRGPGAGLAAAALVAIVPSYISRSVAGSYDNEGIAIFALVLTFYLYVKTLNTGSLAWGTLNALAYLYMVSSWGGYTFIINLLPIHALASMIMGRMTKKLYIAYAPLVVLGTLLAMLIQAVGFNAVRTSEHYASFMVLILLQVAMTMRFLHKSLEKHPSAYRAAIALVTTTGIFLFAAAAILMVLTVIRSPTLGWSGRSLTLLDPTYAKRFIPIIASVSEHQPTSWTSYFMDIHITALLLPAGLISTLRPLSDSSLFALLYALTSLYFSGVMVRLMLVVAPAACLLSGMALSDAFSVLTKSLKVNLEKMGKPSTAVKGDDSSSKTLATKGATSKKKPAREGKPVSSEGYSVFHALPRDSSIISGFMVLVICLFYTAHCVWVSSEAYSAPSIVLSSKTPSGTHIFDDFREAYSWLRHCTEPDDIVASWWDYGYQTTAIANRTVLVDNNTWNNTHIATVGRAMASPESKAYKILQSLDVKYVFVIFGGLVGYPSDDINKFLWMVRIGGGVFPEIKEPDYMGKEGYYRIDKDASPTMLNTLMYKLSYYRFAEASSGQRGMEGFDRVRNTIIGNPDVKLTHFEEVFTSEHWMVRIYKLKELPNRTRYKSPLRSSSKKALGRTAKGRVLVSKESGLRSRLVNKYHWDI